MVSEPINPEVQRLVGEVDSPLATAVRMDIQHRAKVGFETYGTYLTTFNGRNALVDLYEETLDALVYSVQNYMETQQDDHMIIAEAQLQVVMLVASALADRVNESGFLSGRSPEPMPRQGTLFSETTPWEVIE